MHLWESCGFFVCIYFLLRTPFGLIESRFLDRHWCCRYCQGKVFGRSLMEGMLTKGPSNTHVKKHGASLHKPQRVLELTSLKVCFNDRNTLLR